jgi:tetratricopeptide (TPR) repeat protein
MLRIPSTGRRRKRSESSDQLFLDFGDSDECSPLQFAPSADSLEKCFHEGCTAEEEGRLLDAVTAYRRGQQIGGPHAVLSFNLANALFALGRISEAVASYQDAVALRPSYCEAWNNLGVALAQTNNTTAACAALKRAVVLDPHCMDAHYNLADLLDGLGQLTDAREHWLTYLRSDPDSEWAAYARTRLKAQA